MSSNKPCFELGVILFEAVAQVVEVKNLKWLRFALQAIKT